MAYFSIGIILAGLIFSWFAKKQREEKNVHDEVYERNTEKAKTYSWYATIATLVFFMWMFTFFNLHMSAYLVVTILFAVQIVTWGIVLVTLMVYTYS